MASRNSAITTKNTNGIRRTAGPHTQRPDPKAMTVNNTSASPAATETSPRSWRRAGSAMPEMTPSTAIPTNTHIPRAAAYSTPR